MEKQTHIISKKSLVGFLNNFDSEMGLSVVSRTDDVAEANVNVVMHNEHEGLSESVKIFNTVSIEDDTDWEDSDAVLETIEKLDDNTYVALPLGELGIDEYGEQLSVEGDNVLGYATAEESLETDVYDFMGFDGDTLVLLVKAANRPDSYEVEFALFDESGTAVELSPEQDEELEVLYKIIVDLDDTPKLEPDWDASDDGELIDLDDDNTGDDNTGDDKVESGADSQISDDLLNDFNFDFDFDSDNTQVEQPAETTSTPNNTGLTFEDNDNPEELTAESFLDEGLDDEDDFFDDDDEIETEAEIEEASDFDEDDPDDDFDDMFDDSDDEE
jgi:hypothetical protein